MRSPGFLQVLFPTDSVVYRGTRDQHASMHTRRWMHAIAINALRAPTRWDRSKRGQECRRLRAERPLHDAMQVSYSRLHFPPSYSLHSGPHDLTDR